MTRSIDLIVPGLGRPATDGSCSCGECAALDRAFPNEGRQLVLVAVSPSPARQSLVASSNSIPRRRRQSGGAAHSNAGERP